jgi:4-amino-4-deoxy-L-arabinose transferase-like glycosyltransferase
VGFGLTLGNELTPKLLHGATLLLLFFTFIAFERRYLSTGAGLLGTLIFVTMPIVAGVAGTAGIDVASGALQFLALFALILAIAETRDDSTERGWIRLAGLLTGVAATCKFTSVSTIPIAWALILARHIKKGQTGKTALRAAWSFLLYAALAMFPFYLKNAVFYHNPVYPVAGTSWGTPRVTVENWNRVQGDVGAPASLSPVALASRLFLDPDHDGRRLADVLYAAAGGAVIRLR